MTIATAKVAPIATALQNYSCKGRRIKNYNNYNRAATTAAVSAVAAMHRCCFNGNKNNRNKKPQPQQYKKQK